MKALRFASPKLVMRDDVPAEATSADVPQHQWEQVVFAEMLIPDTPNTYGDIYTREAIKQFCYEFARQGFGIDINHDNMDIKGVGAYVCESFIVRPGDPDFIEGSWVVGMKITSDVVWGMILDGDLNGYSFEALVNFTPIVYELLSDRTISGITEPDILDGHTHGFTVLLGPDNDLISGGTTETDGHSHTISGNTITDTADSHHHRYQIHS